MGMETLRRTDRPRWWRSGQLDPSEEASEADVRTLLGGARLKAIHEEDKGEFIFTPFVQKMIFLKTFLCDLSVGGAS